MPEHLTWFKWEADGTWIFGFTLLVLTYYLNPTIYLIDPAVMNIAPADAVRAGAASLVVGWFVYDFLCRSWFGTTTSRLAVSGFILFMAATYAYTHVFSGRGAFIQVGALVGTVMAGNVLVVIIPGQRKVVASLLAGDEPDPIHGQFAKQRSVHNNYLTLPVVFTMLSNHYSFTYSSERWSWLILACVFVAGLLVRHWFNTLHASGHSGAKPDWRLWPAAAVPVAAAITLGVFSQPRTTIADAATVNFADVQQMVDARCHVCHSAKPQFPEFAEAPKGVMFDTPAQIKRQSQQIMAQAVKTHTMPLGNVTEITDTERSALGSWIVGGSKLD